MGNAMLTEAYRTQQIGNTRSILYMGEHNLDSIERTIAEKRFADGTCTIFGSP